jgi:hypothetical protein
VKRKKHSGDGNGRHVAEQLFGKSFYENLETLMDEQIAEMMKDPEWRRYVREFNFRMFEMLARIAKRQMTADS